MAAGKVSLLLDFVLLNKVCYGYLNLVQRRKILLVSPTRREMIPFLDVENTNLNIDKKGRAIFGPAIEIRIFYCRHNKRYLANILFA
jgi:hypothetical protein